RSRRGSRPSTRTVPWLTPTSPVFARIRVVLPASFGPISPLTRGPTEQLSSDSATFGPYQTDTLAISTVAWEANAGSCSGAGAGGVGGAKGCISVPPSGSDTAGRRILPTGRRDTRRQPAGHRWRLRSVAGRGR